MATINKENNEKPLFELKETKDDRLIFQRVVKAHGKSKKEIGSIVDKLPIATVHVMSEDYFERLKKIEENLSKKIIAGKEKNAFKDAIFRFLEL